ncbi:MAG TPA: DUF6249 domain-containing protein [Steroidobacteraceae bacterium]|nr:DUF6249 domain-containing protein [Steroidobacteraceae bacterium]
MSPDVIAVLIPIIAIIGGCVFAALRVALDYRNRRELFQLHHAERLAAIEKGVELPPLPPEFLQGYRRVVRGPAYYLRSGLFWLLLGGALFVALYEAVGPDQAWWGLLPAAIGAANLLFYFIAGRKLAEDEAARPRIGAPPGGASEPSPRLGAKP